MFKYSFVFFVVLVACANCTGPTDLQKQLVKSYLKRCMAESGTTQDIMARVVAGELVEDPHFVKLTFCVDKLSGLVTEAGEVNLEVLGLKTLATFGTIEASMEMAKKCGIKKATPEQTAFQLYKCYMLSGYNLFEE